MNKQTIGWGVIGIGRHADTRMMPALRRSEGGRLVAVASRSRERASAFANKHGASAAYDSYERLLEDPEVHVVYVATPHSLHVEHVLQAAAAGKHVLCEKPMALTAADARTMVSACRRAGVLLGTCFQNRYHPAHREARRLVSEGKVGQVLLVRSEYSRSIPGDWEGWRADRTTTGSATLTGLGLHALDVVRYICQEEVEEVAAMTDIRGEAEAQDHSVAMLLRLTGGGFAQVNNSRSLPFANNNVVISGSAGRLTSLGTVGMFLKGSLEVVSDDSSVNTDYSDPDPATGLYAAMINDFNSAVSEGRQPGATGEDGLAMASLAEAVQRSAREGSVIRINYEGVENI